MAHRVSILAGKDGKMRGRMDIADKMKMAGLGLAVVSLLACGTGAAADAGELETGLEAEMSTEDYSEAETQEWETEEDFAGFLTGGWTVNEGETGLEDNPEVKAAFEKATEKLLGADYEPIAYLGSQVVAGSNYCILCRITPVVPDAVPTIQLVYVYENLEHEAELLEIQELVGTPLLGGFRAVDGEWEPEKNEEEMAAFEQATEGLLGADYEPVALLARQIVSGINYCFLCRVTPVVLDPQPSFEMVTVYKPLKGRASLGEIREILLGVSGEEAEEEETGLEEESAEDDEDEGGEAGLTGMPNPFRDLDSLDEAQKAAGFSLELPEAPEGYGTAAYRVMGREMIEVIYSDKPLEDGGTEACRIRKAPGEDDISGDYNEYSEEKEETLGNTTVTLKGDGGQVSLMTWTDGEYSYSVSINSEVLGLTAGEALDLAEAVR